MLIKLSKQVIVLYNDSEKEMFYGLYYTLCLWFYTNAFCNFILLHIKSSSVIIFTNVLQWDLG